MRVLSRVFRGKFLAGLEARAHAGRLSFQGGLASFTEPRAFRDSVAQARKKDWVVYSKPPFGGPEIVLRYLARYTHCVAIANSRLVALEDGHVTFRYHDRRRGDMQRTMRLSASEFLRRFLLHVLPKGFAKVRHYGILANRTEKLERCRALLAPPQCETDPADETPVLAENPLSRCPSCGSTALLRRELPREPEALCALQPAEIDSS